jgi:NAD(P)-dependent dehydrogenase (short-subunit alcohol dehydrogenase family)
LSEIGDLMRGKICLITGATSGIGAETAKQLAERGASVIVVGRSIDKCVATVARIRRQTGNPAVDYLLADLSSQKEIRGLAQQFKNRYTRLDLLVNNAGGIWMTRQESVDGIEMTLAVNHLSYFMLTQLLLDTLIASAPARIVNVSSLFQWLSVLNFDDLQGRHGLFMGLNAYNQSKLANVLFTYELARRLEGSGVTANVLHPGAVRTRLFARNPLFRWILNPFFYLIAVSVKDGAQTSVYLASSPEVAGVSGKYFVWCKPSVSAPASYDQAAQRHLWQVSAEMTGIDSVDP